MSAAGAGSPEHEPEEHDSGLGNEEYPGFPADVCPEELPDLSQHHSLAAELLKREPGIYAQLRERRTKLGVGFARCIKTGMDNRGHALIKTLGAVAGDGECYDTFAPFFDQLLRDRHGGDLPGAEQSCAVGSRGGLTSLQPDPTGKYIMSTQVQAARCLEGVPFPPAAALAERREVERALVRALSQLEGPLKGQYLPLSGSGSCPVRPGGMSEAEEEELEKAGLLFTQPDSKVALSSGLGRNWPDARGVFVNGSHSFSVWVNEEEHLRATVARQGGEVQSAFRELADALDTVEASLSACPDGPHGFARSDRLGFLTASPANLGAGLRVSVILCLPLISQAGHNSLKEWCSSERLCVRSALGEGGTRVAGMVEISNRDRLGTSEVDTVNLVVEAAAALICAERRMESGQGLVLQALQKDEAGARAESPTPPADDQADWELAGRTLGDAFARAVASEDAPGDKPEGRLSESVAGKALAPPAEAPPARGRPKARGKSAARGSDAVPATKTAALDDDKLLHELDAWCDLTCLPDTQGLPPAPVQDQLDILRMEIFDLMVGKADSGELEKMLGEVAGLSVDEGVAAQEGMVVKEDSELATLRAKAADVLKGAATSGHLETALDQVRPHANQGDDEDLYTRARNALFLGLENGKLEAALQAHLAGRAEKAEKDMDAIRCRVRGALEESLSDGTLERLLRQQKQQRQQQEEQHQQQSGVQAQAAPVQAAVAPLQASAAPVQEEHRVDDDLQDMRNRVKGVLEDSFQTGQLEVALRRSSQEQDEEELQDIRNRMKGVLEDSFQTGQLEVALRRSSQGDIPPPVECQESEATVDEVRERFKITLEESLLDGSLERVLHERQEAQGDEQATENAQLHLRQILAESVADGSLTQAFHSMYASVEPAAEDTQAIQPVSTVPAGPMMAMLEAVSVSDRRIGLLEASIREVEALLKERDSTCARLQEEIAIARRDSRSLEEEIEQHRRILAEQDNLQLKLQESQQKLVDDIQEETFKQRHAALDLDSHPLTARSELSTVCTVHDISDRSPPPVAAPVAQAALSA